MRASYTPLFTIPFFPQIYLLFKVQKNPNFKLYLENYRKIWSGKITIELENQEDEKEHLKGFIKLNKDPKVENITHKNVILRESTLRITDWLIGIVIFVGEETFIAHKKKTVLVRLSYFEDFLNRIMLIFVIFILILSVVHHFFQFSFLYI